jgi:hypothetical protein
VEAAFTCSRCGAFFCAKCGLPPLGAEGPVCRSCVDRAGDQLADDLSHQSFAQRLKAGLASAGAIPVRPLSFLERWGRAGSVALLILGAVLVLIASFMIGGPPYNTTGLVLGALLGAYGVAALVRGVSTLVRPSTRPPRMTVEQLKERLKHRPAVVCMSCHLVVANIPCDVCGSSADCLEVRTEDDEKMVLASFED